MKKKLPTPDITESEAPTRLPDGHRYVLLRDGTVARRIRSHVIGKTEYYTVTVGGATKRIRKSDLAAILGEPAN